MTDVFLPGKRKKTEEKGHRNSLLQRHQVRVGEGGSDQKIRVTRVVSTRA